MLKNLTDDRRIYSGRNREIFSLAVVYQHGLHIYNELWAVEEDADGRQYASAETGFDGHIQYEDRFYFDMEYVHLENEIEIALYKDIVHQFSCERFYRLDTGVFISSLAE